MIAAIDWEAVRVWGPLIVGAAGLSWGIFAYLRTPHPDEKAAVRQKTAVDRAAAISLLYRTIPRVVQMIDAQAPRPGSSRRGRIR